MLEIGKEKGIHVKALHSMQKKHQTLTTTEDFYKSFQALEFAM